MKWAAQKALEFDDTLAEAHVSLARSLFLQWDFSGAERELRRVLELNPDAAGAYELLLQVHTSRGRFEDAIAAGKRNADLDPFSPAPEYGLGITYFHARRFDMAIEHLRRSLQIDPLNPFTLRVLSLAHAWAGQPEEAVERCRELIASAPGVLQVRLQVGVTYAKVGQSEEARKILEEVEKSWKADGWSSFWIAAVHACLGEKDAAFEWLERSFEERASIMVFLQVHTLFENLRDDPRFDSLVKRIGIPD